MILRNFFLYQNFCFGFINKLQKTIVDRRKHSYRAAMVALTVYYNESSD